MPATRRFDDQPRRVAPRRRHKPTRRRLKVATAGPPIRTRRRSPAISPLLVLPLVVTLPVGAIRHDGFEAALPQLDLESLANRRVFIAVLDLVACQVLDLLAIREEPARRVKRKVPRRIAADVEVLVKPPVRRHEDAPLVPRNHDFLFPL